jgi:hypothetical protein
MNLSALLFIGMLDCYEWWMVKCMDKWINGWMDGWIRDMSA